MSGWLNGSDNRFDLIVVIFVFVFVRRWGIKVVIVLIFVIVLIVIVVIIVVEVNNRGCRGGSVAGRVAGRRRWDGSCDDTLGNCTSPALRGRTNGRCENRMLRPCHQRGSRGRPCACI